MMNYFSSFSGMISHKGPDILIKVPLSYLRYRSLVITDIRMNREEIDITCRIKTKQEVDEQRQQDKINQNRGSSSSSSSANIRSTSSKDYDF
jgi:hypothetical protein